jgi:elongation factor G
VVLVCSQTWSFTLGPADQEFLDSEEFKSGKERLQFEWDIVGGAIDKNYQKPIRDGFTAMMSRMVSSLVTTSIA